MRRVTRALRALRSEALEGEHESLLEAIGEEMRRFEAEDARLLRDISGMRRAYGNLFSLNRELIAEHTKRANNHSDLLTLLREVNAMIQRCAKLRVGTARTRIVSACRAAIKANNIQSLFKLLKTGNT